MHLHGYAFWNYTLRMEQVLSARYHTYLRLVLALVRELLPEVATEKKPVAGKLTQADIAAEFGENPTTFSSRLNRGHFTRSDVELLGPVLQSLAEAARETAEGDEIEDCEEVGRLVSGGLDRTVRLFMNLAATPPGDTSGSLSTAQEIDRLRSALTRASTLESASPASRSEALRLGRSVWPGLPDRQIGFAYHAIGDLLLHDGENDRSLMQAAEYFRVAEQEHATWLIKSVLNRTKCYVHRYQLEDIDEADREAVRAEGDKMFRTVDLLGIVYTLFSRLKAENAKAIAEWMRQGNVATGENVRRQSEELRHNFRVAALLFEQAIEEEKPRGKSAEHRAELAHLLHNAGYCWFCAGDVRARETLEEAIELYAAIDNPQNLAYNLMYLALAYEAEGKAAAAVWCIRAAVRLYGAVATVQNENDRRFAKTQAKRIVTEEAKRMPKPSRIEEPGQPVGEYVRVLLAEYGRQSRQWNARERTG